MSDHEVVRTTLDIADDVLQSARSLSEQRGVSLGQVISELAREGLQAQAATQVMRDGVPILPQPSGAFVTPDLSLVNQLRDENL